MAAPRKTKAQIIEIIEFQENVRLFRIKPEKKVKNKFRAGQFLHLTLEEYDPSFNWPESRVFSIATSPDRADELDIIVSRKGSYTGRMFDELKQGNEVWLKLPYGDFNFKEASNKKNILVAGGTGISPFISFLQQAIDQGEQLQIDLYYGVSHDAVIIIDDLLSESTNKLVGFKYQLYIEHPQNQTTIEYKQGKLPITSIVKQHAEDVDSNFYISGPQGMIKIMEKKLKEHNISPDRIHYDEWE